MSVTHIADKYICRYIYTQLKVLETANFKINHPKRYWAETKWNKKLFRYKTKNLDLSIHVHMSVYTCVHLHIYLLLYMYLNLYLPCVEKVYSYANKLNTQQRKYYFSIDTLFTINNSNKINEVKS